MLSKLFSFFKIYFNWRLITLQYCSGFYHTLTWISHGCTCVPHSEPPSHLLLHPIPRGHPSAPALSTLSHASNLDWWSVSYVIIYMFQCYSFNHPTLAMQRLLSLIRSHLFIFAFISFALGVWLEKKCSNLCHSVLPMYSCRCFMVSCLIFKYLKHFEFISINGVKVCSNFINLHVVVQFSQYHLLKRLFSPISFVKD